MSAPTRKLAAILAADVVGYSKLMGEDETRTLAALRELRNDLFQPTVSEHRGDIVKSMGDGWLVEFASVVDAVNCAIQVQEQLDNHEIIKLRMGIHIGDIVHEDEDIYGDGVNIAARLQEISEPGGIALSDTARKFLDSKLANGFRDAGEKQLKNIAEAVRVFVSGDGKTEASNHASNFDAPLALPDKPSIAVLPFENMLGDPEQEYFSDGITEDIITALSRVGWFFVIARNSSFTYKGRAVEIRQVSKELGVRYVLEGSVRKSANRLRVTAQLIDAETGNHIWADRFDGYLDDVFDFQDNVKASVVGAIEPKLRGSEIDKAIKKRSDNLSAYDFLLRAYHSWSIYSKERNLQAQRYIDEALKIDPHYGGDVPISVEIRGAGVAG